MIRILIIAGGSAFASWVGTWLIIRYAERRGMLDMPNSRSSHDRPTPRGGGGAVAGAVLSSVGLCWLFGEVELGLATAVLLGGGLVALVGWLDDVRSLSVSSRTIAHVAAACIAVAALGPVEKLQVGELAMSLGPAGTLVTVLAIVWLTNLYNFMDGIDGLAAGEAVWAALVASALLTLVGATGLALLTATLAGASLGFLFWNWAPARVFLGDVGSGFIGYVFGVLALASDRADHLPAAVWLLVLGAFIADATVTLLRRVITGEKWYQAHRLHAYQRLAEAVNSHRSATLFVLMLNVPLGIFAAAATLQIEQAGYWTGAAVLLVCSAYLGVERIRPMKRGQFSDDPREVRN